MKEAQNDEIYTPEWVAKLMVREFDPSALKGVVLDLACGDGNLLLPFVEAIIRTSKSKDQIKHKLEKNIIGRDISEDAIEKCKERFGALVPELRVNWNIQVEDTLVTKAKDLTASADLVIGNPPYIRIQHLSSAARKSLQSLSFTSAGITDTFLAFFELGLNSLKKGGRLVFISPNSFIRSKAGRNLREALSRKFRLKKVLNFGSFQCFPNATVYAAITVIDKLTPDDTFEYFEFRNRSHGARKINDIPVRELTETLPALCGTRLYNKLRGTQQNLCVPLGSVANIHVGITTLADSIYILQPEQTRQNELLVRSAINGRLYTLEKDVCRPIVKASTLASKGPEHRFIVFPYEYVRGRHRIIEEGKLRELYPYCWMYLCEHKQQLDARDKGKPNSVAWYAYGRQQGLDSARGAKFLTSGMNKSPNFIWRKDATELFYAGYCVKPMLVEAEILGDLLNSKSMCAYVRGVSADYSGGYKSYAKSFIEQFPIPVTAISHQLTLKLEQ